MSTEIHRLTKCIRDNLQESFAINVIGVHWVTREFLPLLRKGNLKKVANM
jgi:NAD(P)-dependent dehydrogenase (short-subunit alcohol dehydrogenase family)